MTPLMSSTLSWLVSLGRASTVPISFTNGLRRIQIKPVTSYLEYLFNTLNTVLYSTYCKYWLRRFIWDNATPPTFTWTTSQIILKMITWPPKIYKKSRMTFRIRKLVSPLSILFLVSLCAFIFIVLLADLAKYYNPDRVLIVWNKCLFLIHILCLHQI